MKTIYNPKNNPSMKFLHYDDLTGTSHTQRLQGGFGDEISCSIDRFCLEHKAVIFKAIDICRYVKRDPDCGFHMTDIDAEAFMDVVNDFLVINTLRGSIVCITNGAAPIIADGISVNIDGVDTYYSNEQVARMWMSDSLRNIELLNYFNTYLKFKSSDMAAVYRIGYQNAFFQVSQSHPLYYLVISKYEQDNHKELILYVNVTEYVNNAFSQYMDIMTMEFYFERVDLYASTQEYLKQTLTTQLEGIHIYGGQYYDLGNNFTREFLDCYLSNESYCPY